MVGRRNNRSKNQSWVSEPQDEEEYLPEFIFAHLVSIEIGAEYGAMIKEGTTDAECVPEMHRRHGSEGVDVLPGLPDRLGVVMTY
jgi:hypothetical protein